MNTREQRDGGMALDWGTDVKWSGNTPTFNYHSPPASVSILSTETGRPVVTLYPNGRVALAHACSETKAAREFWKAVERVGLEDATRDRLRRWEELGRRIAALPRIHEGLQIVNGNILEEIHNLLRQTP